MVWIWYSVGGEGGVVRVEEGTLRCVVYFLAMSLRLTWS